MKKVFVYIFIVFIAFWLLRPFSVVLAEDPPMGKCLIVTQNYTQAADGSWNLTSTSEPEESQTTQAACYAQKVDSYEVKTVVQWTPNTTQQTPEQAAAGQSAFEQEIGEYQCVFKHPITGTFTGCLMNIVYLFLYVIPALLLAIAAYIFNVLIGATIQGDLISKSEFLSSAWVVVRDLSNVFFIFILLYVAIKIILDMGGHHAKQTIVMVILMALLINFSMFFSKVVIDTSNILALVFYNKLEVKREGGETKQYVSVTGEKDVAGALAASFDPTKLVTKEFFDSAKQIRGKIDEPDTKVNKVPPSILMGMMLLAGAIMIFAAYALAVSGFAFIGRLIELWILIIFSPFAFMSSTLHELGHLPYVGWSAWFSRLLKSAFMAPIFMFFLYFIFLLLEKGNPFSALTNKDNMDFFSQILAVVLPAVLVMILLLKATEFAKKGSGQFSEMLTSFAKKAVTGVGGLALGAATGGAAVAGRAVIGRAGAAMAASEALKTREAQGGVRGWASAKLRDVGAVAGKGSFDVRSVKIAGKTLGSATGLPVGEGQKGGFVERRKEQIAKRQERAKSLELGEDSALTQELRTRERQLEELKAEGAHDVEEIDKRIEGAIKAQKAARETLNANPNDQAAQRRARTAAAVVNDLRAQRSAIKNATGTEANMNQLAAEITRRQQLLEEARAAGDLSDVTDAEAALHAAQAAQRVATVAARYGNASINRYEDLLIPQAKHEIHHTNRNRKVEYAENITGWRTQAWDFVTSGGQHSFAGAREAAHKIRSEAKIEHSPKGKKKEDKHDTGHEGDHGGGGAPGGDHGGGHGGGGGGAPH